MATLSPFKALNEDEVEDDNEPVIEDQNADTAVLLSLGANIVDKDVFESELVSRLEQRLKEEQQNKEAGKHPNQLEDGEVSENSSADSIQHQHPPESSTANHSTETVNDLNQENDQLEPEETEHEKRVRCGEVTPFGSGIEGLSTPKKDTFLNFNKYLQDQQNFQKKKQDISGRKKSEKKKGQTPKKHGKRDPLNMGIMFPKKRKRKEELGLGVSDNLSRDVRKRPGKSFAETTSTYLNESDDSEYMPSDLDSEESDKEEPQPGSSKNATKKSQRKTKLLKKTLKDKSSDDEFSDYESDCERPAKRLKKENDDGDFKSYQTRVQQWKENETRFTGEFQTFEGGFKIPIHLWESLYTYQKVGVKWLWELHQQRCGGILGDEMGLGKTIEVINFLIGIACSNVLFRFSNFRGLGSVLLITPATVMHQWVREFHKWWPPFLVAILHQSGSFSGTKAGLIRSTNERRGILITSYSGLVNNQNEILQYNWHYVILDEGHKIRNPDAQITLVAKQVKTPHRLILSGSPLQNNLKELWSLFDFVYPGKLGTLPTFMEQFCVPITHGGYSNATQIQVAVAYKCAKALRDMINPYLLRRMKSDVKDHINLPEKSEQVLFCKMTNDQKDLYKTYIASKEIDSIIHGRFNLFVGLINLRKICNHPHLFDGGPKIIKTNPKYSKNIPKAKSGLEEDPGDIDDEGEDIELNPDDTFGHWTKSGKMIVVETLLKLWHAQGHKVLLFSQSRQMLCILENFVRQNKYKYLRLDGSTSIGSRQPLITKFNEDPDVFVFILTTRVGGLGVNLTAANRVILYDPDWNPSTDMQARERAWRIGQHRAVTIYRLILSGTIEEKMYHRQVFKQFLTNRVLKDPRQKRFFKSNEMLELFQFNEGTKGTESEAIFAGTGSAIKVKKSKKSRKEPREKSSGKLKDVPNLVKQRPSKATSEETNSSSVDSKTNAQQDEYVLQKLFSNSGVHAALRHDKIVDTDEADYMIVEKEAESVAKKAIESLKQSRELCYGAESGRVNWTGNQGEVKDIPTAPKLRFGKKKQKSSTATSNAPSSTVTSEPPKAVAAEQEEEDQTPLQYFSGQSLLQEALNKKISLSSNNAIMSSADLLSIIRARKSSMPIPDSREDSQTSTQSTGPELKEEQLDLLRDIREFISFQALIDGQATTDELIEKFGPRLPNGQSPLFKQMLGQLCTFRRVEGRGMWRLKPEFR